MHINKIIYGLILAVFCCADAHAQVAQPTTPGFLSITGCPGGNTPCFYPGGATPSAVTNLSGSITTGGTFQTVSAGTDARKTLDFVNICNVAGNCTATTDVCYLYFGVLGSASTTNSIPVSAGQEYLRSSGTIPSAAINVTCTSTGDKFYLQVQ